MMIDGVLCEDLVAIVDPDPARFAWLDKVVADTCGAAERENYAKARRFATYQDMFDKMGGEIDAIVVETPNHPHVLPAVMAMRRGIHVYLDKPLCLTAAECDLILAEARKNPGLVTQCGTYGHSFPSMKYCVDRIAEGALGEVREVWAYDDRCNSIYQRPAAVPPPKVLEVENENGFENDPFYKNGILFVGTKGNLWFTHHGGYRFMPRKNGWCIPRVDRPKDFNYRIVTPHHFHEFYAAIRERREANDCFEYSVPLAKTVCLGNISALAGKGSVLKWDGHHVTNNKEADSHVTKEYRSGWNPFA